jgi:hypothetical protein
MAQDKSSVMLLVAGFFGSLVAVGKANHASLRDNLLAISAGTSSAYFLTPVVFEVTGIAASPNVQSGMAFLLGVLGMRGVEMLIAKVFPGASDA